MKLDRTNIIQIAANFSVPAVRLEEHADLQAKLTEWTDLKEGSFAIFGEQCAELIRGKDSNSADVALIAISTAAAISNPGDDGASVLAPESFITAIVIPEVDAKRLFVSTVANMVMN